MRCLPSGGHPPQTVVTAFSMGKGVISLPPGSLSSSAPHVRGPEVMTVLIMSQSLSLCMTGYAWLGFLKKPLEVVL
jgi:hypothetical protein